MSLGRGDIDRLNQQVVTDLVQHINPSYRIEFTTQNKYERWDATIYNEMGKIVAYIESKVRFNTPRFSAIVGIAKATLRQQSRTAPVFVVSWYTKYNLVYLCPFAVEGKLHDHITPQGETYLQLPFNNSWCYTYNNRTLKLLSKPKRRRHQLMK